MPLTRPLTRAKQIRDLAAWTLRHPRTVRHVPRLARTYNKTTLETRQPWLPFDVIDMLDAVVTRTSRVFEYGGGGSTAWFADRAGAVVTVEHDPEWHALLSAAMAGDDHVRVIFRPADDDYAAYVSAIGEEPDESLDIVVVDGRERVRCFQQSIPKIRPGGLLLLDDVDRERYSVAFSMINWPVNIYRGLAPCKGAVSHTAVFTRTI